MARLTVEILEGRDLMSAGVFAGTGPVPTGPQAAVTTELEEFANAAVSLTAPLGSTKGSVADRRDLAATVVGFTPPIGSDPLALLGGYSRRPERIAFPALDGNSKDPAHLQQDVPTQGIIAILIGLRAPTQPADLGAAHKGS
jgi:hypothetical protein